MASDPSKKDVIEDAEDDYMTMTIVEPEVKESSIRRAARLRDERAARGYQKSKAELAAEEKVRREAALAKPVELPSKKRKLLEGAGFTFDESGKLSGTSDWNEPLPLKVKEGRAGVGSEQTSAKRQKKPGETAASTEQKPEETSIEEFRERKSQEHRQRLAAKSLKEAATLVAQFEEEKSGKHPAFLDVPLRNIPLVMRGYIKRQLEKEKQNSARASVWAAEGIEEELEEEDTELEEYEALDAEKRLHDMEQYLREEHHYCFWCGTFDLDSCPGPREEDHE